ncbi:DNA polymerase III subunit alpha [Jeotgalibaca caeni]|uniref:DNA polymerase III subunit alpha n=1 Tax=Jeotgalibaca caeni TaxID=3028623 RepID=UPI00237ED73E|nr:DNA polymerase III subunit alpha [Jeotgalibaca caeni]MDE1548972.1 DNA polymerase III subunit alpha [Jeotgalibaca caeni]
MSFVQLQVRSSYSLLKSNTKLADLVALAKEKGYQALALTDENVLFGQVEFFKLCKKAGMKPIIGLQLEFQGIIHKQEKFPLVLVAKNLTGYQKLMQLSTISSTGDEEAIQEALRQGMEQVIAITPGEKGEIERLLRNHEEEKALQVAAHWKEIFSPQHFYLGVQIHRNMQSLIEPLKRLGNDQNISLTAMHDVRYLHAEDRFSCQVLQAIGNGEQIDAEDEARTGEHYLPDMEEISARFTQMGLEKEAAETVRIAQMIDFEIPLRQSLLPRYPVPNQQAAKDYLLEQCLAGLNERVPEAGKEYQERITYELAVINEMGFNDYFLIVWDVMDFARKKGIFPGAGRGSAAGSLVAYALRITHVDPIAYNLLFERFLNRERYNMPDIDLDFPDDRRDEVLRYVRDKYGHDHVAQIMTVGTLAAKMSLRDTGRVFGLTPAEAGKWSNAVPAQLGIQLRDAYRSSKELQKLVGESKRNRLLFETAVKIEGVPRHLSTHAAGIVISDRPLVETIPLQQREGELFLTQYQMGDVEEIGLLKMDFLGLKNLTILNNAVQLTKQEGAQALDIFSIPLDDDETLALFRRGDTNGIFQFESAGIKNVLRKLEPTSFEDLVAVNALYRPGPMEQIDTFIKRKKGLEPIVYPHEDLHSILDVTYGIMVYQEQVMQVASALAGFSLGEADLLRRAIGKKQKDALDREKERFVEGAFQKGYTREKAEEVYRYIERFANYGFNRSHSVAYSFIAYQMAYMKVHYPAVFFAALLNSVNTHSDKMQEYMLELKKHHIPLAYPHINTSGWRFSMKEGKIQFGFGSIKGLRRDFVKEILTERKEHGEYQDLVQFLRRISPKWLKEEVIQPLIMSGFFDSFGYNRATLTHSLPGILSSIEYSGNNIDLFHVLEPKYIQQEEFPLTKLVEMEEQYLGYSLVGHPLEEYSYLYQTGDMLYIAELAAKGTIQTMGFVKEIKRIQTKKGDPMAFIQVTDATGMLSATLFPETYFQHMRYLKEGSLLVLTGRMEDKRKNAEKTFIVQKLLPLTEYVKKREEHKKKCYIRFEASNQQEHSFEKLKSILLDSPGQHPVIVVDTVSNRKILLDQKYHFEPTASVMEKLTTLFGSENVVLQ